MVRTISTMGVNKVIETPIQCWSSDWKIDALGNKGDIWETETEEIGKKLSEFNSDALWLRQNIRYQCVSPQGLGMELRGMIPLTAKMKEVPADRLGNLKETGACTLGKMKIPPYQVKWVDVSVPEEGQMDVLISETRQERRTAAQVVPVVRESCLNGPRLERVHLLKEKRGEVSRAVPLILMVVLYCIGSRINTSIVERETGIQKVETEKTSDARDREESLNDQSYGWIDEGMREDISSPWNFYVKTVMDNTGEIEWSAGCGYLGGIQQVLGIVRWLILTRSMEYYPGGIPMPGKVTRELTMRTYYWKEIRITLEYVFLITESYFITLKYIQMVKSPEDLNFWWLRKIKERIKEKSIKVQSRR